MNLYYSMKPVNFSYFVYRRTQKAQNICSFVISVKATKHLDLIIAGNVTGEKFVIHFHIYLFILLLMVIWGI